MMRFDTCAIVLVMGCVVIATIQAASLAKIDCTKCRLDVYSFGSKDYDCGISRHNNLPICVVDCKILYNMLIPIPNLVLDFDLNSCLERSAIASVTTAAPRPSTTASSSSTLAAVTTAATPTTKLSTAEVAATTTTATTLATVIPEASGTSTI